MLTTIRKPNWPPGKPDNKCSTQTGPSTPWKAKLNTVAPIKINNTKQDNFMVESMACRMSFMSMRFRAKAMIKADPSLKPELVRIYLEASHQKAKDGMKGKKK
jgi:hypothetical protein